MAVSTNLYSFDDILTDQAGNETDADFARSKICEIVKDPETNRLRNLQWSRRPSNPKPGYDAITGPLLAIDIRGRGGRLLREEWRKGGSAYLGVDMARFPNLSLITGPGSPSVVYNMARPIEHMWLNRRSRPRLPG